MTEARPTSVQNAIDRAYAIFEHRPAGGAFCTLCWDKDEVSYITSTPVRQISTEFARKLMWETADHWEDSDVYRHYLPRILEALAPPEAVEDIFPLHLSEVLIGQSFGFWSEPERACVYEVLDAITPLLVFDSQDQREWARGCLTLKESPPLLPPRQ